MTGLNFEVFLEFLYFLNIYSVSHDNNQVPLHLWGKETMLTARKNFFCEGLQIYEN